MANRIDVHARFLPPPARAHLLAVGHDRSDGVPQVPEWTAAEHVATLDPMFFPAVSKREGTRAPRQRKR